MSSCRMRDSQRCSRALIGALRTGSVSFAVEARLIWRNCLDVGSANGFPFGTFDLFLAEVGRNQPRPMATPIQNKLELPMSVHLDPVNPTRLSRRRAASMFFALAALGSLSACVTRETVVVREPAVAHSVVVRHMPTAVHEDRGPQPSPGYGWVPGHWKWEGNDWAWVHGQWVRQAVPPIPAVIVEQITIAPSAQHFWVPGHWVWRFDGGNSWIWVAGSWHR